MESNTADEAADRALSSVSRKLDKSLSVEYTVNQLVADAMDSVNLSHMYSGKTTSSFMRNTKLRQPQDGDPISSSRVFDPSVQLVPCITSSQIKRPDCHGQKKI